MADSRASPAMAAGRAAAEPVRRRDRAFLKIDKKKSSCECERSETRAPDAPRCMPAARDADSCVSAA
eukprot:scaffold27185_cov97-Isochrysis_galbana.AAC.7